MLYGYGYHAHPEVAHVTTQDVQGINPPVLWSMTTQGVDNVQYWVTTGIVDLQGMNGDLLAYDIQMIGQAITNAMQTMGLLGYDLQLMGQVITNAMKFMLGYTNMQEGQWIQWGHFPTSMWHASVREGPQPVMTYIYDWVLQTTKGDIFMQSAYDWIMQNIGAMGLQMCVLGTNLAFIAHYRFVAGMGDAGWPSCGPANFIHAACLA